MIECDIYVMFMCGYFVHSRPASSIGLRDLAIWRLMREVTSPGKYRVSPIFEMTGTKAQSMSMGRISAASDLTSESAISLLRRLS